MQLLIEAGAPSLTLRLIKSNPVANRRLMIDWLCKKYGIDEDYTYVASSQVVLFSERKPKSFRDEFPFLSEPDCPAELEALASRKFTKYHAYVNLHKQLRECTSTEQCAKVARELINSYLENRMIWEELNYYQQHHSILGKHPIFTAFHRRRELLTLNVKQLMVRQKRLRNNIWRVQDEMAKRDKPHLELERRARLQAYQSELAEINRLLGDE
ncbi:hypothetical protein [Phocaeicola plebeius]|uniref:hypothetical protein n=1 Tax=Phocaeicola plebeius TaxID=310297 RepID=UPI003A8E6CB4